MRMDRQKPEAAEYENLFGSDRLTGLPCGEYLYALCGRVIANRGANENRLTFVYYNVENFKAYNHACGYEEGDRFLRALAKVIAAQYQGDIVGRTSNDHFLVLTDQGGIERKSDAIHAAARELGRGAKLEVCAGVYAYEEGVAVSQAHDCAKTACDTLKGDYSRRLGYYDSALRKKLENEKYILDNLDLAIRNEYLEVYYQPIIRVFSGKICAVESLVRWNDPRLGFLQPGAFVPLLESRRLIYKVDSFVLDRVCRDQLRSQRLGEMIVPASVNLSRLDFQLIDVYKMVSETVKKYGISPKSIRLEITESALNDDEDTLHKTIARLREDGFEIWLDDFGSEYSTLNTLQNFSFDLLKIDMKFFKSFATNEKARTIIATITDMAKRLHLRVLAEGIETEEQFAFLKKIGCDKAQGYHFSKPCPLEVFYGLPFARESADESAYFTTIGEVNFLSPNPFEDYRDAEKIYNLIPTAIAQYRHGDFTYLYMNDGFLDCLKSMGVASRSASETVINDDSARLRTRLAGVAQKCRADRGIHGLDFIFNGFQINLRAREIAYCKGTQALFVTMMNLSSMENLHKIDRLETTLNYLYSIYDRVDLLDPAEGKIENVYLNSQKYRTSFEGKTLAEGLRAYGQTDIAPEDWERFNTFYDMATLEERFKGHPYLVERLQTRTDDAGVLRKLYILIRVSDGTAVRYLSCVRDINGMKETEYSGTMADTAARDSDWYRLISGVLGAAVFEWDLSAGHSYASGRAYEYELCQSSLADILANRGSLAAVYSEDIPVAERFFAQAESGAATAEAILRLKRVDGSYRWSRLIALFRYDENGVRRHIVGVIMDVEKEHAGFEQAQFLNKMPTALGVFEVVDGVTRQLFMNDCYYKLIEDTREARAKNHGLSFIESIHPENRAYVLKAMRSVIVDGEDYCSEACRVRTGTGSYKWIRFSSRVAERRENYLLIYSTYVSIEDEMRSMRAREETEKKLEAAVQIADLVVWEYDCRTRTVLQTERSKEKHGYARIMENVPESLVQAGYIHPDSVGGFLAMYSALLATKKRVEGKFCVRTNGQSGYWWEHIVLTPILDEAGNLVKAIGTGVDISAHKVPPAQG